MECAAGKPERYVPRGYGIFAALRIIAPGFTRKVLGGQAGAAMRTSVTADAPVDGSAPIR
jgi:hypothetical protein